MLVCLDHWRMVSSDSRDEVYRTVKLRGPNIDETWAPWWRASHKAIAEIAKREGREMDVEKWLAKQLAFADELERD